MPSKAVLDAFVARVMSGAHAEAIEEFYTEDASMQENFDPPRVGRDVLVDGERKTLARFKSVRTSIVGAPLVDGDVVMINWVFEFEHLDGAVMRFDEIARQDWCGDKIWRERFYYDPKSVKPASQSSPA
ncbi:MAG: nuclear transport factor 2 family protein [Alphaproteobacteria bacterium]|nr:nuclear transport factor 2 family protein [Alphaproteobacteria bacterium]